MTVVARSYGRKMRREELIFSDTKLILDIGTLIKDVSNDTVNEEDFFAKEPESLPNDTRRK